MCSLETSFEKQTSFDEGDAEAHLRIMLFFQEIEDKQWRNIICSIRSCKSPESQGQMLREIISQLLHRQEWDTICKKVAWDEFSEKIVSLLFKKALNQAPTTDPNVYELITGFYLQRKDYLRAARTMYRWAEQLSKVPQDLQILSKRRDALTAALNYLMLSSKEGFSFLRKFTDLDQQRSADFIDVVLLQREWTLLEGRLLMCKEQEQIPSQKPKDVFNFLLETRRFDEALSFAKLFELSTSKVLQALVKEAVTNDTVVPEEQGPRDWLKENQRFTHKKFSRNAWDIVQGYLDLIAMTESSCMSSCLSIVLEEILRHDLNVPYWVDSLFMQHDVGAYMQLLSDYGKNDLALTALLAYLEPLVNQVLNIEARVFLPYWAIDAVLLRAKEDQRTNVKRLFVMTVNALQTLQKRVNHFENAARQSTFTEFN